MVIAKVMVNTGVSAQGVSEAATGWKKFIPKKPTTNEMGMNMVVMMVRVFMMSFMRLLITDR